MSLPSVIGDMSFALRQVGFDIVYKCVDDMPVPLPTGHKARPEGAMVCFVCGESISRNENAVFVPQYQVLQKNGRKKSAHSDGIMHANMKKCVCAVAKRQREIGDKLDALASLVTVPTVGEIEGRS
jgi:hypothetical protein